MLRTSETVAIIAGALLVAQKAIDTVSKDAENPYFSSKYADLSAVMGAIKKPLNDNGIVILQFPDTGTEGYLAITTRLQHEAGEFIEATATVPLSKADPQAFGSAITYARRYGLQSIIGLLAEDDDGNAASDRGPAPMRGTSRPPPTRLGGDSKPAPAGKLGAKPQAGKLGAKPATAKAPVKGKAKLFPVDESQDGGGEDTQGESQIGEDDIPF